MHFFKEKYVMYCTKLIDILSKYKDLEGQIIVENWLYKLDFHSLLTNIRIYFMAKWENRVFRFFFCFFFIVFFFCIEVYQQTNVS